jgi:hypothetical protein
VTWGVRRIQMSAMQEGPILVADEHRVIKVRETRMPDQ